MVLQKLKINYYYYFGEEFVKNVVILGNVDIYGIAQILLL